MRTYAQLTTSFVVFCNRVGVDESITFWGGSEVIAPSGEAGLLGAALRRGPVPRRRRLADVRRERIALPLLRDERPELQVRELARIVAERAGLAHDSTAETGRTWPRRRPTASRIERPDRVPAGRCRRRAKAGTGERPAACSSCRPELAIDTDVARRVIGEFIRGQLRQAGFERAVLGLSGGIDSALVAYLVAEAIGAERLLCVLMPYRTSSPASRRDAEDGRPALGCASELVDISPMVDGYFGRDDGRPDGLDARCAAATSWPASGWRSCTTAR